MNNLFSFLKEIEEKYSRTIFNFHLINSQYVSDIYFEMKSCITSTNVFDEIVIDENIRPAIKKLVYCDINLTKHVINHNVYPDYDFISGVQSKFTQFFDINSGYDDVSMKTVRIFERGDKSSLVSYVKTTNKKRKIDYGEIKKTIHNSLNTQTNYFSGKKSDDYLSTTIKPSTQPWIKTITKRMRVDINQNSIVTKGKSSILQTIEIIFVNRTCVKIFKDSTMHIILSKDKSEKCCEDMVNKLFSVYLVLFSLLKQITKNDTFNKCVEYSRKMLSLSTFEEKIEYMKTLNNEYGIQNFQIGMFNLTFIPTINYTVFPSLLKDGSKIKFFKGKKLNIVALRSIQDCQYYVNQVNLITENMKERSNILNTLNIEFVCVEKLKELLV